MFRHKLHVCVSFQHVATLAGNLIGSWRHAYIILPDGAASPERTYERLNGLLERGRAVFVSFLKGKMDASVV